MQLTHQLSTISVTVWRTIQIIIWIIGIGILIALIFFPTIGLHAFWNVLIPVAPALFVLAVGLWRNICPLAFTALIPRHLGWSKKKKISVEKQGVLNFIGLCLLFLIVPLRHVILDTRGLLTAMTIIVLACTAVIFGLLFEWKSGWCSGICPVHPVEKLYGQKVMISPPNAHCELCQKCVTPCPDSTLGIHPLTSKKTIFHKIVGFSMVGGFPGFIWGWFQVPDYYRFEGLQNLAGAYGLPFLGFFITLFLYLIMRWLIPAKFELNLISVFTALSVSCYYWYRLPALFGFGTFQGDGMLLDLQHILPTYFIYISRIITTLFFCWWLILRPESE